MKKQYINPEIEVVKINTMQILAGSPTPTFDDPNDSGTGGLTPEDPDGPAMSRGGFWDDEDEY